MFNLVVLVGRLGRDPELSVTSGGIPLCKFSIAVDRGYKKADGERETDWIDIVTWRQRAEFAANYLKKGSLVLVRGQLQVRKWESPEGQPRRTYEVQADQVEIMSSARGPGGQGAMPTDADAPPPEDWESSPSPTPAAPRGEARKKIDEEFPDARASDDAFDPFGDE